MDSRLPITNRWWRPDWRAKRDSPDGVNSRENADAVFQLMVGIAATLNKPIFLTPEFGSAPQEMLRELAVCSANPGEAEVRDLRG